MRGSTLSLLGVGLFGVWASVAVAQVTNKVVDIEINGIHSRIPHAYFRARNTENGSYYGFAFWLSDGKPPLASSNLLRDSWPPDPGRLSRSPEDFVVWVTRITYLSTEKADRTCPGGGFRRFDHGFETEAGPGAHGMECRRSVRGNYLSCLSPPGDEVATWVWSSFMHLPNQSFTAYVFSRGDDNLDLSIHFPTMAWSRWPEVLCAVLSFTRTWRVDGPASPNCSTLRLALMR